MAKVVTGFMDINTGEIEEEIRGGTLIGVGFYCHHDDKNILIIPKRESADDECATASCPECNRIFYVKDVKDHATK